MDIEGLAQELRLGADSKLMRTQECPDEHDLAAIVEGTLAVEARERIKTHLADCDYCISRIGELVRLGTDDELKPPPDLVLARARRLVAGDRRPSLLQRVSLKQWAAAAVVVLAVAMVLQQPWAPPVEDDALPESAPGTVDVPSTVRRVDPDAMRPQITAPLPGSAIKLADAELSWTPISDSVYYEVFILSDSGDVLWQQQITGTSLALRDVPALEPGLEYFARIDAYLAEARRVSSPHVVFTVRR